MADTDFQSELVSCADVSNPACIGFQIKTRWTHDGAEGESEMQVVFTGEGRMAYGPKLDGKWGQVIAIREPERFGPIPQSWEPTRANRKMAREAAIKFATA